MRIVLVMLSGAPCQEAYRDTYPDLRTADPEPRESQGCVKILIPHRARRSPPLAHPARHEQGQELTVPVARFERSVR